MSAENDACHQKYPVIAKIESDEELADLLISRLNGLLHEIPEAGDFLYQMIQRPVWMVSEAAIDHPTLQVTRCGSECAVGWLGLLNGLVGTTPEREGWGYISARAEDGRITRFERTPPQTVTPCK